MFTNLLLKTELYNKNYKYSTINLHLQDTPRPPSS